MTFPIQKELSKLNKEVSCIDTSLSVSFPCHRLVCHLHLTKRYFSWQSVKSTKWPGTVFFHQNHNCKLQRKFLFNHLDSRSIPIKILKPKSRSARNKLACSTEKNTLCPKSFTSPVTLIDVSLFLAFIKVELFARFEHASLPWVKIFWVSFIIQDRENFLRNIELWKFEHFQI